MEIAHGIHAIPANTGPLLSPFVPQVYLAVGGEGVLIDSGYGDEQSVSAIIDFPISLSPMPILTISMVPPGSER